MNSFNIKDWMKNYNVRELFLWIQTLAVHPANQLFQTRFETLLGFLFSIPTEKFSGNTLTRNEFCDFIQDFETNFSHHFLMFEDWQPFRQLKLIPYFFQNRKYYFFYGDLERPYEFLRQFDDLYLIDNDESIYREFALIKELFTRSLDFQSQIIEKLNQNDEAKIDSEHIYVPTQQFFNNISPLFKIDPYQVYCLEYLSIIEPGVFKNIEENIFEKCVNYELFKSFYIRLAENNNFFLIPQLHLEILYNIANQIIKSSLNKEEIESLIFQNFISRLWKKCLQFFTIRKILAKIIQKETNHNLLESVDIIARVDANKIFLFKAAGYSFEVNSSKEIENALNELQKVIDRIKEAEIIELHYFNDDVITVPAKVIEFFPIIVFENTTFNYKIELLNDIKSRNIWIVDMMDLQGIFEFLPSDLSLVKFLRNDRELFNKSCVFCADYLDRFAYYIINGESYPRIGISPHMLYFEPHAWHEFYHKKLYEKYQDNIHELIEYDFPNTFNHIKQVYDNVYEVIDTSLLNGGSVVKYGEYLIWIMYPVDGFNCTKKEIEVYSRLIGPLYADYLNRLREPLIEFFGKYNFSFQTDYRIGIYPVSYIERTKQLNYLKSYIAQLSKENPLIIVTNRISDFEYIRSCVIYDYKYLVDLFEQNENNGERFCIKQLIKSLVLFFDKNVSESDINRISEEFINKNIPLQKKAYTFESIPIENPKLDYYGKYQDLSKADLARVNREIAEYLANSGEKPGEYHYDEAKRLNNIIFRFLQKKLEDEIREYNESILFYAYKEVELIEGQRKKNRIQFGMDASKYTEYEIVKKDMEETIKIAGAVNSAKYIIETILKIGTNGKMAITNESWHYLHAIASVLYETTFISDYIYYDIVPHALRVSNLFEIEDIKGQEIFSHIKFYQTESELKVDSAKRSFEKLKERQVKKAREINGDVKPFPVLLQEINEAFNLQYGFSFDNFITVLNILGRMDFFDIYHFPLSLVPKKVLIKRLRENIRDSIDEIEIQKILNFVSLDFSSYKSDEELIPSRLLRRKERLNLSPLVFLNSGEYLYGNQMCLGAASIWLNSILTASFPYILQENSPINMALKDLHKHLDNELEKEVKEIAQQVLGKENLETRIKDFKRLSSAFPHEPSCGEIDILAVNKSIKVIFVLDAKNINRKLMPSAIRRELRYFYDGEESYLKKLTKKEKFILENLQEVLKHFSIEDTLGWQVKKAFVVNINYPSAYSLGESVDFVLIGNLATYLKQIGA